MPWDEHATVGEKEHLAEAEAETSLVCPYVEQQLCFLDLTDGSVSGDAQGKDRCCAIGDDGNPCLAPAEVEGSRCITGYDDRDVKDADEVTDPVCSFEIRVAMCEIHFAEFCKWQKEVSRVLHRSRRMEG